MIAERPQIFYPVNLDLARRNMLHYAWTTDIRAIMNATCCWPHGERAVD